MDWLFLAAERSTLLASGGGLGAAVAAGALLLRRRTARKAQAAVAARERATLVRAFIEARIAQVVADAEQHAARHPVRFSRDQLVTAAIQRVRRVAEAEALTLPSDVVQLVKSRVKSG